MHSTARQINPDPNAFDAGTTDASMTAILAALAASAARGCANRAAREKLQIATRAALDASRMLRVGGAHA